MSNVDRVVYQKLPSLSVKVLHDVSDRLSLHAKELSRLGRLPIVVSYLSWRLGSGRMNFVCLRDM